MKPTVIDLFAGVGGLSLGFEQAGFRVVLANEYDNEIAAAYRQNHRKTKMVVGDITALDLEDTFGACVSHVLRGQENISMPPKLQDHRLCGGAEQEHREKVYRRTGCKAAHHYRTDHRHHEERTKA